MLSLIRKDNMQELLSTFGIQPILLIAQIVNFLIIFYLLKRFAWKPILKTLNDRKAVVAESIKNAEDTQKALDKALEKEKEILQKAQAEAQNALSDAKAQAQEVAKMSEESTRQQVERMIADAHKKIEKQTSDAEKQLATKVTTIAADMLRNSLKGMLDEKEQEKVVEKTLKNLRK